MEHLGVELNLILKPCSNQFLEHFFCFYDALRGLLVGLILVLQFFVSDLVNVGLCPESQEDHQQAGDQPQDLQQGEDHGLWSLSLSATSHLELLEA